MHSLLFIFLLLLFLLALLALFIRGALVLFFVMLLLLHMVLHVDVLLLFERHSRKILEVFTTHAPAKDLLAAVEEDQVDYHLRFRISLIGTRTNINRDARILLPGHKPVGILHLASRSCCVRGLMVGFAVVAIPVLAHDLNETVLASDSLRTC